MYTYHLMSKTGLKMVARDSVGESIAFHTLFCHGLMGVDEGEARGVSEALKWAVCMSFSDVIVETDAQRVHDALNCPKLDASLFGDFIETSKKNLDTYSYSKPS